MQTCAEQRHADTKAVASAALEGRGRGVEWRGEAGDQLTGGVAGAPFSIPARRHVVGGDRDV
eukprot:4723391-Pleurochrysis_carterae.AAC.1